ncbi:MAG: plasmid pRiA4b ORF-3 family protein [Saccharofermentanales bacterium]
MKIALTKKLVDAMGVDPSTTCGEENPIFSWTANWTKVWSNHRTEDMIVMVNNATRFVVALYQVKRKDLKKAPEMMRTAISSTLLSMNVNPEIVEEYLRLAGETELFRNSSRQAASWVTKAGQECAFYIGDEYNGIDKMFSDTVGIPSNHRLVNYSGHYDECFIPYQSMFSALAELTGKPVYRYRAFELLATLDLKEYKAVRRIIVPADMEFAALHKVLQSVFNWDNCHLYDFTIYGKSKSKRAARIVPFADGLEYDEDAVSMGKHTLSEFLPESKQMLYTYDMGDNWEHEIQLVRVIEEYDKESPYLLEASGQTPPEDVGGVYGFLDFREIMMNPKHPRYREIKEWAGYWSPDLSEWKRHPQVIHV